jgi:hypothetical protein
MREFGLRLPAAVASSLRTNTQMHSQSIASEEIQNHVNSRKRCYPYNKFFVTGRSTNNSEPSQSKKMKPSTRICRPTTFVTTRKSFHYRIISRAVFRGRIMLASSSSIIKNHYAEKKGATTNQKFLTLEFFKSQNFNLRVAYRSCI